jgi:hypothetical protein
MAGDHSANPLGRDPFSATSRAGSVSGSYGSANPVGIDDDEPDELAGKVIITTVKKDWNGPPSVTPGETPVSGNSLKEVLHHLEQYAEFVCEFHEWGRGAGYAHAKYKTDANGKTATAEVAGEFFMDLPKWSEYDAMTQAQQTAWRNMIAALDKHERNHVKIGYEMAEELVRKLRNLDVDKFDATIKKCQEKLVERQEAFDSPAQTDHGKNDWPPFPKVWLDTSKDPPAPPKTP